MPDPIQSSFSRPAPICQEPANSSAINQSSSTALAGSATVAPRTHATQAAIPEPLGEGAVQLAATRARSTAAEFVALRSKSSKEDAATEPAHGNTNQERTQTRQQSSYVSAGINADGNIVYAGAAASKGKAPDGSGDSELFSASAQAGAQLEVQAAVARLRIGSPETHVAGKALEAEIHAGTYNPDGSRGLNLGASATVVGGEVQATLSGNSASFGVSLSAGAEGSIGHRDQDADGRAEYCARAAIGPLSAGVCIEPAGIVDAVREVLR